jgi:Domain of unknown function (DUF5060)
MTLETMDSERPFPLFGGEIATKENAPVDLFARVGGHNVMISPTSWWGIRLGVGSFLQWTVVDLTMSLVFAQFPILSPLMAPVYKQTPVVAPISAAPVVAPTAPVSAPRAPLEPSASPVDPPIAQIVAPTLPIPPVASESVTDYHLDIVFRNGNVVLTVPGYFAADRNSGHTSATSGSVWQCHLAPTFAQNWTWQASLRTGPTVAVDEPPRTVRGMPVPPIDGMTGTFFVLPSNKTGFDLCGKGLLCYVAGKHHLQFTGTREWLLKVGADSRPMERNRNHWYRQLLIESGYAVV